MKTRRIGVVALVAAVLMVLPAGAQAAFSGPGEKLTATGEVGKGDFGNSVAVSADGNTALVGGWFNSNNDGAVWVFTRSGSGWTQQAEIIGPPFSLFGRGLALSPDGSTALIGAPRDSAAFIYTRSGSNWTPTASFTGPEQFGYSVALSGKTALIGAWRANSVSVLTEESGVWKEQINPTTKQPVRLTGAGEFGVSVALSGNLALIGAPDANGGIGAASLYSGPGPTWTEVKKLTGAAFGGFGTSVALSQDASTALVGACCESSLYHDNRGVGSAWEFTSPTWIAKQLIPTGEIGEGNFGESVALSADGSQALIGAPDDNSYTGAAWLFPEDEKLTGAQEIGTAMFGQSLALSEDGSVGLIGGCCDNSGAGAIWAWPATPKPAAPAPTVTATASSPLPMTTPVITTPKSIVKPSVGHGPVTPLLTAGEARKAITRHVGRVGKCRRLSSVRISCAVVVHRRHRQAVATLQKGQVKIAIEK